MEIFGEEPLSYVGVDPERPVPSGFRAPDGSAPSRYWSAPANAGKIVAHKYASFSALQIYDVYLSGFETNGVYIGRSDLEEFDLERREGRWRFDFSHLARLDRFEVHEYGDGLAEIRLLSTSPSSAVNFALGNLSLAVGESADYLLGIDSQPLVANYDDDVFEEPLPYVLAYDEDGKILDHHARSLGVERISVERLGAREYRVCLIAHERILPVWEGRLQQRPEMPRAARPAPG